MSSAVHCAFVHPEPLPQQGRIFPVFMPFAGCPHRCVFCAQQLQTGQLVAGTQHLLLKAGEELERLSALKAAPMELAFFGGTFTALPREEQNACVHFAQRWQERGLITRLRCSTRPDSVTADGLAFLKESGFSLVELGIQSFCDAALAASGRGYDGATALRGCEAVKAAGLELGIQLMPGMPGLSLVDAAKDVALASSLSPACLRLYPCVVLGGTALEDVWRKGEFTPWDLDETVSFLADACLMAWGKGIPVIRMGLAPEQDLEAHTLAGPWHPALGSMARGLAMARFLARKVAACALSDPAIFMARGGPMPLTLHAPKRYQGEFWGHKGTLTAFYAALGIVQSRLIWWDNNEFLIEGQ